MLNELFLAEYQQSCILSVQQLSDWRLNNDQKILAKRLQDDNFFQGNKRILGKIYLEAMENEIERREEKTK